MTVGFFVLFDDKAILLNNIAKMSKFVNKKTVGILGDDLAVNAEKVSGFVPIRDLPALWKSTKH